MDTLLARLVAQGVRGQEGQAARSQDNLNLANTEAAAEARARDLEEQVDILDFILSKPGLSGFFVNNFCRFLLQKNSG